MTPLPAGFRFSQSSLQDYTDCPRRFQLRYLERLDYPAMQAEPALENERQQWEGAYFHRLVQQYILGVPADKLERLVNTPNLQAWWDAFLVFSRNNLEQLAVRLPEASLSAPLEDFRLLAKYDLLTVTPDGRAIIYDWKTSRRRPRNEWLAARMQTRVYRALLVQAGAHLNGGRPFIPDQIEMVYWLANAPQEPARFPYASAQFKRDWDVLQKLIQEIACAQEFTLTSEEQACRFCTYRSYCNRGVSAGSLDDLEGGMEDENTFFELNFEQIAEIEF
jgi:RecB family exonuclease